MGEGTTLGVQGIYCTSKKTVENKVKPGSPRPKQTEKERMQTRLNVAPQETHRNWVGSCIGKVIVMQEGGGCVQYSEPTFKTPDMLAFVSNARTREEDTMGRSLGFANQASLPDLVSSRPM